MTISLVYLAGHLICSTALCFFATRWAVQRRWAVFFALLFFIAQPGVCLVWGPYRHPFHYVLAFLGFLVLAKGTQLFYVFLKTQEAVIRWLFWAALLVLPAAVIATSVFEVGLRRDDLTYWKHEAAFFPRAASLNRLAQAYLKARDPAKARESYIRALALDSRSQAALDGLAAMARAIGDWSEDLDLCQKVLRINAHNAKAYLGLGEAYRQLGDSKDAVETYGRLLTLFPDNEKIDVAVVEAYGKAIEQFPQEDIYKEKREEVLADFEKLSKRKNYSAADYYNLGFLYEQVGGKEEAVRFYSKAVELRPDYAEALYNLANVYRDTGNYKDALAVYGRLLHFHPRNVWGYLNMGNIFQAMGDVEHARRLYLKVIDLDANSTDAYFDLGYLSESQGEFTEAVNYYEKAVEVVPKNAEAYYNLGNVYARLGQSGEAIASYLKTVAINPRHQDAFVNLSILAYKSRDFKGAIHYLEQARALGYNPPIEYVRALEPYQKQ